MDNTIDLKSFFGLENIKKISVSTSGSRIFLSDNIHSEYFIMGETYYCLGPDDKILFDQKNRTISIYGYELEQTTQKLEFLTYKKILESGYRGEFFTPVVTTKFNFKKLKYEIRSKWVNFDKFGEFHASKSNKHVKIILQYSKETRIEIR